MITRRQFISLAGLGFLAGCSTQREDSDVRTEPQRVPTPSTSVSNTTTPDSNPQGYGGTISLRSEEYESVSIGADNSRVRFSIDAKSPVDFFIYTSEQFAAYEYAVDHGVYPMPTTEYTEYGTAFQGDIELNPDRTYVLVIDNSRLGHAASTPASKTVSSTRVRYSFSVQ